MNRARFLAIPAIVAICVLFYWKLTLSSEYVWFDHPDMCYIELPRLNFEAREIHQGRFPLWDPGIWMGQPMLGQTQPGPVFPLNLLFFLLPLRDGNIDFRLLNWYFVIAHLIAALATYALCRDLRRSHAASIIAALALAFGGFIGTVVWLDVFNGAIWTPAICLFFLRAARGIRPLRNAALCGLFLGIAWLSGHHEIPVLVSYALAAGWAYTIWRKRTTSAVTAGAITFVLTGLIAAVQLWPTAEFARRSHRWVGLDKAVGWGESIAYTVPTQYSLPVRAIPGMVFDSAATHADTSAFLGVVVIVLALFAIATAWRHPVVRWMTVLAAVTTLYSIGAATPLQGLLYTYAPLLGKARVPVRGIHLLNFALVVLAAYGFDALLARRSALWSSRLVRVLAALGAIALTASLLRTDGGDGLVLGAIVALVLAAMTFAWLRGRFTYTVFASAVVCLMLIELYPVGTRTFSSSFAPDGQKFVRTLTDHRDVVDFLRREPFPRRVAVTEADIPTNFADWHGFDGYEGYVAGVTTNLLEIPRHTRAVQNLYGITHHVARTAPAPDWTEAFEGESGVKVFRNPQALPRAWSVHAVERIGSRADVDPRLSSDGFDPRRTALIVGDLPSLETCEGDDVQILARAPNRIRLQAKMRCKGLLVLSETWYPGWIARVDGQQTSVLEVFGSLRGIVVEGGEHSVDLLYRPASVYGGAALTAAGLLLTAVILAVEAFRRRRRRGPRVRYTSERAQFSSMRIFVLLLLLTPVLRAVDGKWTPQQVLELDPAWLKQLGLQISPDRLWNAQRGAGLLSAAVNIGGCSAGFVSNTGLILTNHHCLFGVVQEHSSPSRNLIDNGFLARKREEELPSKTVRVTVPHRFSDVTKDIESAVPQDADDLARQKAIDAKSKALVAECEKRPFARCRVAAFDGGVQYMLIDTTELQDVRLVYAPPRAIGEFGGEIDNWMWPRHTGDFSVARAYVAPDGSPAAYSKNNVPYKPQEFLPVAKSPLKAVDFVMVLGYPGTTYRALTADEMAERRELFFPGRVDLYGEYIRLIEETTKGRKDGEIAVAANLKSLHNRFKNAQGQIAGFNRGRLLEKQRQAEQQVVEWARSKPEHKAALAARDELSKLVEEQRRTWQRDFLLDEVRAGSVALAHATTIVRLASERQKPDAERESAYQERLLPQLKARLDREQNTYDIPTDKALFAAWLRRMDKPLPDTNVDAMYASTKIMDREERLRMFGETPEQLKARRDPFLDFALALEPGLQELKVRTDRRSGAIARLRPQWRRAVLAHAGKPVAPDANSTLRVSFAHIKGYRPRDGVEYLPFTTLAGVIEKHTGEEPFDVPDTVRDAAVNADPKLHVNFLADGDTTGGNSGSPVVNGKGELVGLNFDRVWENVANDFGYNPDIARNISVDVQYLIWMLENVSKAGELLKEMFPKGR